MATVITWRGRLGALAEVVRFPAIEGPWSVDGSINAMSFNVACDRIRPTLFSVPCSFLSLCHRFRMIDHWGFSYDK